MSMALDTSHLLNVFPEEMWHLILGNVDNASDYFKICAASPGFGELFSKQRVHLLFEPMMKVLLDKYGKLLAPPKEPQGEGRAEVAPPPYNFRNLRREETDADVEDDDDDVNPFDYLAPLRAVCRSWKAAVDHVIQEPLKHSSFLTRYGRSNFFNRSLEFKIAADYHRFQNHFRSTHLTTGANPFPGRAVQIQISDYGDGDYGGAPEMMLTQEEMDFMYNSSLQMLRDYGRHIHYLSLHTRLYESSSEDLLKFYLNLKLMLPLLPALKLMQFELESGYLSDAQVTALVSACSRAATPLLPPNLEVFIIQGYIPSRLLKLLLLQARPSLRLLQLPELQIDDFHVLFDDQQLHLSLTKLWLSIIETKYKPGLWKQVFDTLETLYGETLTELNLTLKTPTDPLEVGSVPELKLSRLRKLELQLNGHKLVPLDFLLGVAKTLETLDVFAATFGLKKDLVLPKTQGILLYISSTSKILAKSNVWELFPQLQNLRIIVGSGPTIGGFKVKNECTRAESKQSMKQKRA